MNLKSYLSSVAVFAAAVAWGGTLSYKSDGGLTNDWSTAANWYDSTLTTSAERVPASTDTAYVAAGAGSTVVEIPSGVSAAAAVVKVGGSSGLTNELLLSGGTLTTTPTAAWTKGLSLGPTSGTSGAFTMTGGTLNMTSSNNYGPVIGENGTGIFRMSGGTVSLYSEANIQIGLNAGSRGELYLTGGTMPGKNLYLGVQKGATGVLHVSGSSLSPQGGYYYVGHLGTGILDLNYTGECVSGSTGFQPNRFYIGGTGSCRGVGRATFRGIVHINWYAGAADGRGIYVGNGGQGEVDVYGTVRTALFQVGGYNGAEVRLHTGSSTYVSHIMYVGQGNGTTTGSGRLVMDGGTLTLATDTSTSTYPNRLIIGGTDKVPMAGSIRGFGTIKKNQYNVSIAFGKDATVTAAGGTLSFAASGTATSLSADDDTASGWYAEDDGILRLPNYTTEMSNKQYVGSSYDFAVGCNSSGPGLVHSCLGSISNYWGQSCLQGELHGRASGEIPTGCPIASTAAGFWKLRYTWNSGVTSADAYCESFVLKFRLAPSEMRNSTDVVVYRSTGTGWSEVNATYDPATHVVTLAPIKYTAGKSVNIGWFAIARRKAGLVFQIR